MARKLRRLRRSKKGSLTDLPWLAVGLLFIAIVILVSFKAVSEFNDAVQESSIFPTNSKTATATVTNTFPAVIDNSFLFLAVALAMISIVFASLVVVRPAFIVFYLMGLIAVIFLSATLSNVYQTLAADPNLIALSDQLLFTGLIMRFLPVFTGVVGVILMVVMHRLRDDQ